ncbi:hypothetical protein VQ042_01380 [Aurantimonas sp. A2-1-M11]|uniref:hypothetical protein n=1 Tax=Aurantimonas sp. A2-1-M11 TaxID=3113712 RepID=UPI002F945A8D
MLSCGMCNLYSITKGQTAILGFTRAMRDRTGNMPSLPGVFPDYSAPVVRNAEDGERELTMMRWGMPSPQFVMKGRKVDGGVTNVRNVKIAARVDDMKTRITLHLPSACPDAPLMRLLLERLPRMAPV